MSGTLMEEGTSHLAVSLAQESCIPAGMVETSLPRTPVGGSRPHTILPSHPPRSVTHLLWIVIYWVVLYSVGPVDLLHHA